MTARIARKLHKAAQIRRFYKKFTKIILLLIDYNVAKFAVFCYNCENDHFFYGGQIMDNNELADMIGEAFLWDVVSEYVGNDIENIKDELRQLGYIDKSNVEKITRAEVHESDEFIITDFEEQDGHLTIHFEMPAVINAKGSSNEYLFSVTTYCKGTLRIPDADSYDWDALDFDDMNRYDILAHSDLVNILDIQYEDTEADDLTA